MQFEAFSFREKETFSFLFSSHEQKFIDDIVFYLQVIILHALNRPLAGNQV